MTTDARSAAWLAAWDCLIAADNYQKAIYGPKAKSAYREAMADLQRQAELFTALVNAPAEVGLIAGVELERRRGEETVRRAEVDSIIDKLRDIDKQRENAEESQ